MDENKEETISVIEMGRRLGLKKVDSYWLVHKGFFKVVKAAGVMRVDLKSFEYWYAGQVKYHKINGEPPGKRLKRQSYSAKDIGEMLGVHEATAYQIMRKAGVRSILVDYWKRFPKKDFDKWYRSQSRYRTQEDKKRDEAIENASLSLPDIARMLDITRKAVYSIIQSDPRAGLLEIIMIAGRKRITKKSFDEWYAGQKKYLKPSDRDACPDYKPKPTYQDQLYKDHLDRKRKRQKRNQLESKAVTHISANADYLTVEQAAKMANRSEKTILCWISEERFPVHILSPLKKSRIERTGFEKYIAEKAGRK